MSAIAFLSSLLNAPLPAVLSVADWEVLIPELRQEQLTPFVYARLRASLGWSDVPKAAQHDLAEDFQAHSMRTFLMESELAAIAAALDEAGVPVLLLKGAALGRMVYASPAERPVSDLDLLIPADRLERARMALAERDYQSVALFWLARWQQRYRAELPLVCTAPDRARLLVELHWSLVELPYYIDRIPMADIWQAAEPIEGILNARLPDPATALLHSCAHWGLHHSQEERLLWLLDVDRLARWDRLDWSLAFEQATRWRLQLALRTIVQQAATQLGTPIPPDVRQTMAQWRPDPVETAMWGLGDDRPGRTWQRLTVSWTALAGYQRLRYASWLGLRGLLWGPEMIARERRWHKTTD